LELHLHSKDWQVSSRDTSARSGTIITNSVVGVSSSHGVVVTGASRAPMSCLLGEEWADPPSPLEAVWNSSVESSIIAHRGDGGPLWVESRKAVPESLLLGGDSGCRSSCQ
jgi:hypothetical protein